MPLYDFACPDCGARFEVECGISEIETPATCPVCTGIGIRQFTMPRLLFKADPRDVTPVWHKHDGYAHAHASRRGRHRNSSEEH